jgi:hypothetical protein
MSHQEWIHHREASSSLGVNLVAVTVAESQLVAVAESHREWISSPSRRANPSQVAWIANLVAIEKNCFFWHLIASSPSRNRLQRFKTLNI